MYIYIYKIIPLCDIQKSQGFEYKSLYKMEVYQMALEMWCPAYYFSIHLIIAVVKIDFKLYYH